MKGPDRYPFAREIICRHFGSLNKFAKATGVNKSAAVRVIKGVYGQPDTDDTAQRARIEEALREHGVPPMEIAGLWARIVTGPTVPMVRLDAGPAGVVEVTITLGLRFERKEAPNAES